MKSAEYNKLAGILDTISSDRKLSLSRVQEEQWGGQGRIYRFSSESEIRDWNASNPQAPFITNSAIVGDVLIFTYPSILPIHEPFDTSRTVQGEPVGSYGERLIERRNVTRYEAIGIIAQQRKFHDIVYFASRTGKILEEDMPSLYTEDSSIYRDGSEAYTDRTTIYPSSSQKWKALGRLAFDLSNDFEIRRRDGLLPQDVERTMYRKLNYDRSWEKQNTKNPREDNYGYDTYD